MDAAKISLSKAEIRLAGNAGWILTKNGILKKTQDWLGLLQTDYRDLLLKVPGEQKPAVLQSSPKISRGENYRGLPYLVLDYPRVFEQENVFAVRTLFWWGHFFSITLQLSGSYKIAAAQNLASAYRQLRRDGFFICISEDPWQHHFENDNYVPLEKTGKKRFEQMTGTHPFIKLAHQLPLIRWKEASVWMRERFELLIRAAGGEAKGNRQ